jgi:hypothetical protein
MLGGTHNFCGIVLSWSAVGHQLHAIAEHMAHIACAARVHHDANPIYRGAKVGSLRVQQHQIGTAAQFDPVDIRQAQSSTVAASSTKWPWTRMRATMIVMRWTSNRSVDLVSVHSVTQAPAARSAPMGAMAPEYFPIQV